jgi:phage-related protein
VTSPRTIATAYVEVLPDVKRFTGALSRDLKRATRDLRKLRLGVSVTGTAKTLQDLNQINTAIRTTILGFTALATQAASGAAVALGGAALELSGALLLIPAAAGAAGLALGALKVGLTGVGDALKNFSDADKFNEALQSLSKNAQQTLRVLNEFRPQLTAFKNAVQDALFTGLDQSFRTLALTYLPLLKTGFTAIASQFNLLAKDFAAFATSTQTVKDVTSTLDGTTRSVAVLRPGTLALVQVFRDLAAVGSQLLPIFVAEFSELAVKLRDVVAAGRESGSIADFIARGINALRTLVEITVNVGRALGSIFDAARSQGVQLLDVLNDVTGRIADFFQSTQGTAALQQFFANVRTALVALEPPLKAFGELFFDRVVPILTQFAQTVSPGVTQFFRFLSQALAVAEPGIRAFANGFNTFLTTLAPVLPVLGDVANAFLDTFGTVLAEVSPSLKELIDVVGRALTAALKDPALKAGLTALIEGFSAFGQAMAPLLPTLSRLAGTIFQALGKVLEQIGPPLAEVVGLFIDALLPFIPDLADAFIALFQAMIPIAQALLPIIVQALKALIPILPELVQLLGLLAYGIVGVAYVLGGLIILISKVVDALFSFGELIAQTSQDIIDITTTGSIRTRTLSRDVKEFGTASEEGFGRAGAAAGGWDSFFGAVTGRTEDGFGAMGDGSVGFGSAVEKSFGAAGSAAGAWDAFLGKVAGDTEAGFGIAGKAGTAWATQSEADFGRAGQAVFGWRDNVQAGFVQAQAATQIGLRNIQAQLAAAAAPAGQAGAALGDQFAGGVAGGAYRAQVEAAAAAQRAVQEMRAQQGSAYAAGSGLGQSFASGVSSAIASAVAAAKALANAVANFLPKSPAKEGPFSGRGWTPYRGKSLALGFAQGIDDGLQEAHFAAQQLANTTSSGLSTTLPETAAFGGRLATAGQASLSVGPTVVENYIQIGDEVVKVVKTEITKNQRGTRQAVLAKVRRSP